MSRCRDDGKPSRTEADAERLWNVLPTCESFDDRVTKAPLRGCCSKPGAGASSRAVCSVGDGPGQEPGE